MCVCVLKNVHKKKGVIASLIWNEPNEMFSKVIASSCLLRRDERIVHLSWRGISLKHILNLEKIK